MDPLRMGMGWTVEDLEKPQILIESTYGQSHPGSAHLLEFSQLAAEEANKNGAKAALYFATDICDGMSQGLSLIHIFKSEIGVIKALCPVPHPVFQPKIAMVIVFKDIFYSGLNMELSIYKSDPRPVSYTHLDVYKRQA